MKTSIEKANDKSIALAANLIKKGEVVAIPTETVYGLAADSTNPEAIKKIFEAKGRPSDNPLIAHINSFEMFKKIAKTISDDAKKLADAFWPGPLTIVVPKSSFVCNEACARLDSVGVRMPSNETARKIIDAANVPLSAPSANLSGKPSPTRAEDVFDDMNGRIKLIIDGGDCDAGVESTVISVLESTPVILRPGVITKEQIEKVLKKEISIAQGVTQELISNDPVLSPGLKYKHYAPKAEIIILDGSIEKFIDYVKNNKKDGTFVLCFDEEQSLFDLPCVTYGKKSNERSQAHNLFSSLRTLDKKGAKLVYARCPSQSGVGLSVFNRLIRSAGFKIIKL